MNKYKMYNVLMNNIKVKSVPIYYKLQEGSILNLNIQVKLMYKFIIRDKTNSVNLLIGHYN